MSPRELHFDERMSEREALMWSLEQDPFLRSAFGNVTFFDTPPDLGRFRDRMARACDAVPRLRQRVVEPLAGFAAPTWVEDPLFDLDFHVRRVAVVPPGDDRQVLDLAATLCSDAFDRSRPLWQFTIVEGLHGGRGAMVQRLHHTLADGEASVRLSGTFIDIERDADEPLVQADPSTFRRTGGVERRAPALAAARAALGAARVPWSAARWAARHALIDPRQVPGRAGDAVETARSLVRQVAVTEPARSPLWSRRSLRRHLEVLSLPFADVKAAAGSLDGTINDLFVTGAAGGAGAYHRRLGVDVGDLRMAMPVSTRTGSDTGGNAFAPTRLLVPTGADARERFTAVQDVLRRTKAERATGMTRQVIGVANVLPTPLVARVARHQVATVDFTTSNVRGAPFDLYVAGARIEANYPIGPMAGTAFNLTTLSSSGRLDMGCVIDPVAVADPVLLRACIEESFAELLELAGR